MIEALPTSYMTRVMLLLYMMNQLSLSSHRHAQSLINQMVLHSAEMEVYMFQKTNDGPSFLQFPVPAPARDQLCHKPILGRAFHLQMQMKYPTPSRSKGSLEINCTHQHSLTLMMCRPGLL